MDRFKYVITEHRGIETPFLFPNWVNHKDITGSIGKAISAGEVLLVGTDEPADTCLVSNVIEVSCSGESVSLGVKSRGQEDAKIIQKLIKRMWD